MNLTPEERTIGRNNYYEAVGVSRRDFLKGAIGATVVSTAGLGAMYFGYENVGDPVRVGIIGTGDEGGVLIGALNPEYIQVVAIADIRPYNIHRAFHGHWASDNTLAARPGLMSVYGWKTEDEARKHVKVYDEDYRELLKNNDVEAVIIALPLHLHAEAAVEAMKADKHVLTEKLMAHNVAQCKVMARLADETGLYMAVGHQRHYSILYDNAVHLLKWGILGQIHHIRAQWHRGNLPGRDSWQQALPGGEMAWINGQRKRIDPIVNQIRSLEARLKRETNPESAMLLENQLAEYRAWNSDQKIKAEDYGYQTITLPNGETRSAMEELCRWRLWDRTGGGLMAELGSHQLDAASIFISALKNRTRDDGSKVHPISVHAVGGRHIFPLDRQVEDHVYCMFEFPGPAYDFPDAKADAERLAVRQVGYYDRATGYPDVQKGIAGYEQDPDKRIVVTYSSINGNGYGGYGEVVLGTKGTLILEREQEVLLFKDSDTATAVGVKNDEGGPTLDTQASGEMGALARAADTGPVSRGYTEEMEHWAWCIRNPSPENQPRCTPKVALGDAIIALTSNAAMKYAAAGKGGYIQFKEEWFDVNSDELPPHDPLTDGTDSRSRISVENEFDKLVKR